MNEEIDAPTGSESLSLDEAAAAYAKATETKEPEGQPNDQEQDGSGTTDDELQADEAGEDGDGEAESEGQAEGEDEDEPESEKGRYVAHNGRVKLPDGTESTVDELIKGNLRDRDYRQKTMEAAEVRKAAEAQSSAYKARETQLNQQAEYLTSLIQSFNLAPPDPAMLQTDPIGYMSKKEEYERWGQHLGYLTQQQQQAAQAREAEAQEQAKAKATTEWTALVDKLPELKDQAKATAFGQKLLSSGKAYGFTEDELRSILPTDHRMSLALRDAIKWRELQASKANVAKKAEGRPPVQKGGKRLNPSETRARTASDALTKLGQTGRLDDAVSAYLATQK